MRLWISGAALIAGMALIVIVPRFTAEQTEIHRQKQLLGLTARSSLPACPVGDDLDVLLDHGRSNKRSASLWVPACREQPWSMGRVMVVQSSRGGFQACRDQLSRQPNAGCALEERLAFLSDAAAARSVARVKIPDPRGRPVIWVTSQPLAWGDALVALHRFYFVMTLFTLTFSGMLGMLGRHARYTYGCLRNMRIAGSAPPAWAEFWLLFVLPPYAQSLPVDYRDEYEERLKSQGPAHAANWYQQNVYSSLLDLIRMRLQRIFQLGRPPR
jgi:hypothetical protein